MAQVTRAKSYSFNGDIVVNSLDQGMLAAAVAGAVPYHANIDINKDGVINSMDQGIQATYVLRFLVPGFGPITLCTSSFAH